MRRVFVGGVVLAACLSLAGAEALVIAERGKESDYAIVMPANPSPSHHYAAVELRDFIADATGEKLSVITHAAAMPQKAWVPAPDEYFWIGPGRFTSDGQSAVKGVYIDKIKFTLVEDAAVDNG